MGIAQATFKDDLPACKEKLIGGSDTNYLETINFYFEGISYLQTDYRKMPDGENLMLGWIHGEPP